MRESLTVLPRRSLFALAAVGGASVLLGACSENEQTTASDNTEPASPTAVSTTWTTPRDLPTGWGSEARDRVFPRSVVHALGTTDIGAAPERVAVISTGQMDAALTLGLVPIASTAGDGAEMVPPYLTAAFPNSAGDLSRVAELGSRFEPNLEALAVVAPDLILMNAAGKDAETLYQTLSGIAPTVVTRGTGLYWKQDFQLLADALGRREQAQSWLDEHHERAAQLGTSLEETPSVSFLRKNGDRLRVFGVASFSGSVAEDAGLLRPQLQQFTDETSHDLSAEQLTAADGDRLFYAVQGGAAEEMVSLPLWSSVPAVSAGRAVQVDDDMFYLNTGPTAAQLILQQLETTLRT